MKIKEITNAQDQLNLLRVIVDNTWTAIKQEADLQARQQAAQSSRAKPKTPPAPKKATYVDPPKAPQRPAQQPAQPKVVAQPAPVNLGAPKQAGAKTSLGRTPDELKAYQAYLRNSTPRTPQPTQSQGLLTNQ